MTVVNVDGLQLLDVAVAAHLARYQGESRAHTESDLRIFLRWCAQRQLDPLKVQRVDIELFLRWLQETRRFKPSTVSRRLSVVTCFYRTCVIDTVLQTSPAAYVRRPAVPAESPTLGLSHLQRSCRWWNGGTNDDFDFWIDVEVFEDPAAVGTLTWMMRAAGARSVVEGGSHDPSAPGHARG